ncbi:hypothetical protein IEQ34_001276 [Dendrobium chrysotoxum]|uniref:Uncharacterized protein n=1 Tax=Dendrobium chrysotoxum TaxID=161865 RepID=A0AAV7HQ26_DENCH|nr:hypothetical protein IEQ34_001276 [Dendrobium chrysotoxum]
MGASLFEPVKVPKAAWMTDGSHWPGTWSSAQNEHSKDDHAGIIQAMLTPSNSEPVMDVEANENGFITTTTVVSAYQCWSTDKVNESQFNQALNVKLNEIIKAYEFLMNERYKKGQEQSKTRMGPDERVIGTHVMSRDAVRVNKFEPDPPKARIPLKVKVYVVVSQTIIIIVRIILDDIHIILDDQIVLDDIHISLDDQSATEACM